METFQKKMQERKHVISCACRGVNRGTGGPGELARAMQILVSRGRVGKDGFEQIEDDMRALRLGEKDPVFMAVFILSCIKKTWTMKKE